MAEHCVVIYENWCKIPVRETCHINTLDCTSHIIPYVDRCHAGSLAVRSMFFFQDSNCLEISLLKYIKWNFSCLFFCQLLMQEIWRKFKPKLFHSQLSAPELKSIWRSSTHSIDTHYVPTPFHGEYVVIYQ